MKGIFSDLIRLKGFLPLIKIWSDRENAWVVVSQKGTNLQINDVTFTGLKTVKKTIGAVGVTGVDFNFATADNVTEQVIDLGAIIPAQSKLLYAKMVTETAFAHKSTAIASWSVTSNVTTVVTDTAHGLATGNSVVVAGMTHAAHNGTHTITRVNNTSFTYALTHADTGSTVDTTGTVTFAALALVAELGTTSSGHELIGSETIKALAAFNFMALDHSDTIAPSASATHVYVAITPDGKFNGITTGILAVYVSYIE